MNEKEIIRFLRILILALLLGFLITFLITPKTDCQDCKFVINNSSYDIQEFIDLYADSCFEVVTNYKVQEGVNISLPAS